jgi:hypothetical protein
MMEKMERMRVDCAKRQAGRKREGKRDTPRGERYLGSFT